MDPAGLVSLKSFFGGLGILLLNQNRILGWWEDSLVFGILGVLAIKFLGRWDAQKFVSRKMTFDQVRMRAFFLGWSLSFGIRFIISGYSTPFGLYVSILSVFHYTEFLVTSFTSPDTLSLDSFLLNHSVAYGGAAVASVLEFFIELYLFPSLKSCTVITLVGLALCIFGEMLRKCAMITASKNFTHLVREEKVDGQYLVTHGPYAICRHPGYAGWFWWSLGTQLVTINPVCFLGYCLAVYKFFKSRIYYEEICLLSFYGAKYVNYQEKVRRSGVPFVEGYIVSAETD